MNSGLANRQPSKYKLKVATVGMLQIEDCKGYSPPFKNKPTGTKLKFCMRRGR